MCAQTVGEEDDTGDQVEEQVERVVGEKEWRVRVGAVCVCVGPVGLASGCWSQYSVQKNKTWQCNGYVIDRVRMTWCVMLARPAG